MVSIYLPRRVQPVSVYRGVSGAQHLFLYCLPAPCCEKVPYLIECVQTDNGAEFTNRLLPKGSDKPTLFELELKKLGIRHKLIRPYTPRHNGKVERSHRKDNEEFYASHRFYSFDDFKAQLAVRERAYNNFPMRPLSWRSPKQVLFAFLNL